MFLWWSKDWAPTSPRKGDQHTRAPPSTLMTPTSSSIRRAQIVPRGAGGPGVVFGGEARLMPRGADLVARADAAMSGKSGTVATTTPMSSTRSDALTPSSFFGWTPAFFSWLMPGADEESEQQLSAEKQRVRAALVTVSWCPNSCAVWTPAEGRNACARWRAPPLPLRFHCSPTPVPLLSHSSPSPLPLLSLSSDCRAGGGASNSAQHACRQAV